MRPSFQTPPSFDYEALPRAEASRSPSGFQESSVFDELSSSSSPSLSSAAPQQRVSVFAQAQERRADDAHSRFTFTGESGGQLPLFQPPLYPPTSHQQHYSQHQQHQQHHSHYSEHQHHSHYQQHQHHQPYSQQHLQHRHMPPQAPHNYHHHNHPQHYQHSQLARPPLSNSNHNNYYNNHSYNNYNNSYSSIGTRDSHSFSITQQQQQQQQMPLSKGALFVGDLSFFACEADLRRLFAPYGKLKRAEIKRGRFGDSLMHGFVELDHLSLSAATQAMRELDAAKFMGRRLRVHWAYSNAHRSGDRDRERERWTQLHVTFTTPRVDRLVTEDALDRLFSRFGEVADVAVKKHSRVAEPPFQSGYAFVYFIEPRAAVEAAERLKAAQLGDVRFESALSFRSQRAVDALAQQRLGGLGGLGTELDLGIEGLGAGLEALGGLGGVAGVAGGLGASSNSSSSGRTNASAATTELFGNLSAGLGLDLGLGLDEMGLGEMGLGVGLGRDIGPGSLLLDRLDRNIIDNGSIAIGIGIGGANIDGSVPSMAPTHSNAGSGLLLPREEEDADAFSQTSQSTQLPGFDRGDLLRNQQSSEESLSLFVLHQQHHQHHQYLQQHHAGSVVTTTALPTCNNINTNNSDSKGGDNDSDGDSHKAHRHTHTPAAETRTATTAADD